MNRFIGFLKEICLFCLVGWILLASWVLLAIVLAVCLINLTLPAAIVAAAAIGGIGWTGRNLLAWQHGAPKKEPETTPVPAPQPQPAASWQHGLTQQEIHAQMTRPQNTPTSRPPRGKQPTPSQPPRGVVIQGSMSGCTNC